MSLETETIISIIEALDFEMDDECEHSQHKLRKDVHSGKGMWWQLAAVCPNCGHNNNRAVLVCDRWKNVATGNSVYINCKSCQVPSLNWDWKVKYVRKDEI